VNFRAPRFEQLYSKDIAELEIGDILHLLPRIPYNQALAEYADSDALLLMQAKNCDHQFLPRLTNTFAWASQFSRLPRKRETPDLS